MTTQINKTHTQFKCEFCKVLHISQVEIKTDFDRLRGWNVEHDKRLEQRELQERIRKTYHEMCDRRNLKWSKYRYFFGVVGKWHVYENADTIEIIDMLKKSPIKSQPYDGTIMDGWLDFYHIKPKMEYIECPTCHCKNYINGCNK